MKSNSESVATQMQSPTSRQRKASERGSAIVEASLVCLPFFAIVFLIVDLALVFFVNSTLQYAVEQGVRYAVTNQTNTAKKLQYDSSIKDVVKTQSCNFATDANIVIEFYDGATLAPIIPSTAPGANSGGNLVKVSVKNFTWNPAAPVWRSASPLTFTVGAIGKIEPAPSGIPAARG
jgi:Flp pilus assembly protein TadG